QARARGEAGQRRGRAHTHALVHGTRLRGLHRSRHGSNHPGDVAVDGGMGGGTTGLAADSLRQRPALAGRRRRMSVSVAIRPVTTGGLFVNASTVRLYALLVGVAFILFTPILSLVVTSFNVAGFGNGFSAGLRNWRDVVAEPDMRVALLNTVTL